VRGMTESDRQQAIRKIQNNLTWIAPVSEDPAAEANVYDVAANQAIGVQFCAMNFWKQTDQLKAYMDKKMFGKQSFLIKPTAIRYIIEILAKPPVPQDMKWGTGPSAGSPTPPAAIQLPNRA